MTPWQPLPDMEERITSAIAACTFAQASPDLIDSQRRKIISDSLWLVTEGTPRNKYRTRYRSEGALHIHDAKQLAHEHVWTRKRAIDAMLANPEQIGQLLRRAIGCTVTRIEHQRLHSVDKGLDGWARYLAADVAVFDMTTEQPADLQSLCRKETP